jgi:membrane-anchored glycerophosphoryl diester phosphodiesterase (GDPDase)
MKKIKFFVHGILIIAIGFTVITMHVLNPVLSIIFSIICNVIGLKLIGIGRQEPNNSS